MKLRNPLRRPKLVNLYGWPGRILDGLDFCDNTEDPWGYGSSDGTELLRYWQHANGAAVGVISDGTVAVSPTRATMHAATVDPATWTGFDRQLWEAVANAPDRPADAVVEVWDWRESPE